MEAYQNPSWVVIRFENVTRNILMYSLMITTLYTINLFCQLYLSKVEKRISPLGEARQRVYKNSLYLSLQLLCKSKIIPKSKFIKHTKGKKEPLLCCVVI